jgi:hypothetical protein
MDESLTRTSFSDSNEIDAIISMLERLQQDLQLAKCELGTAIRDVSIHQKMVYDLFLKFHADFRQIDERLHGMEILQQRQNSST